MIIKNQQKDTQHEIYKAYQVLFGENRNGAGLLVDRNRLAQNFREKAYQCRPDRAEALGKSREELTEALKAVALAFDYLADIVGEKEVVLVQPLVDNTVATQVRPWAPKLPSPVKQRSVAVDLPAPKPVNNAAASKIREAVERLKKQTNTLKNTKLKAPQLTQSVATPKKAADKDANKKHPVILGRHLHRRGMITLRQLIAAVAWQRAQRPAVGQIAKSWGILSDEQIYQVLQDKDQGELFCDYAVRKGLMTPFQRLAIVGRQRVMQKPIGTYFVEQGILTIEQIEEQVKLLRNSPAGDNKKAAS